MTASSHRPHHVHISFVLTQIAIRCLVAALLRALTRGEGVSVHAVLVDAAHSAAPVVVAALVARKPRS